MLYLNHVPYDEYILKGVASLMHSSSENLPVLSGKYLVVFFTQKVTNSNAIKTKNLARPQQPVQSNLTEFCIRV
ncbi:hypothetical protein CEXT_332251 [Caerostris extrusa]|uniref:Uncharacterized protein n=1 Tax=Caerostris extrusa TaxID=172846 RepID=A0AAV4RFK0_CAEEX|nr:hypothetical protein CEXT_332251 [Caerostris extrusa]